MARHPQQSVHTCTYIVRHPRQVFLWLSCLGMARNSVKRDNEFVRIREFRRIRGVTARMAPASPRTAVPGIPLGCVS